MSAVLMKGVNMTQDSLTESISALYPVPISDAEAQEAAGNLLGFLELLVEIDSQHKAASCKSEGRPCG